MKWHVLLIIGAVLAHSRFSSASSVLSTQAGRFVDAGGNQVLLRGVNISGHAKSWPFIPLCPSQASAEAPAPRLELLDSLPGRGVNVIRLGFSWEAYEPSPGRLNNRYLETLTRVADAAWARGIYVIIDMHQDGFSKWIASGCGAGFPAWTVPPGIAKSPGQIAHGHCGRDWAVGMAFSGDMHSAFHHFYHNTYGARTAFVELWRGLARHFSRHEGVIGYDVLNEPWGDDARELSPLYEDVGKAIRSEDPTSILFVEPGVFLNAIGLRGTALLKPRLEHVVYAPHYYEPVIMSTGSWNESYSGEVGNGIWRHLQTAREWGVPLFLGEYGAPAHTGHIEAFMNHELDLLDRYRISGTQWAFTPEWNPVDKDGWNEEDLSVVDEHGAPRDNWPIRPSVQRVPGLLTGQRLKLDRRGNLVSFEVGWLQETGGGEATLFLPGVFIVETRGDDLRCDEDWDRKLLICHSSSKGRKSIRVSQ